MKSNFPVMLRHLDLTTNSIHVIHRSLTPSKEIAKISDMQDIVLDDYKGSIVSSKGKTDPTMLAHNLDFSNLSRALCIYLQICCCVFVL